MPEVPPPLLYKYFPPERTELVANLMIRFTQPTKLNDPFDCCPQFIGYENPQIIEKILQKTERALWESPDLTRCLSHLPLEEQIAERGILIQRAKADRRRHYSDHPEMLQDIRLELFLDRMEREIGILCLVNRRIA